MSDLVKVWHILPVAAYERLQEKGWIGGDGRRIWHSFRRPYLWLIEQMKSRLGPSPTGSDYPLWVWYQYDPKRPKPDLRGGGHFNKGRKGYRLELLIPKAELLLSDFDSWHAVLNNWYCSMDESDESGYKQWEADLEAAGLDPFTGPDPNGLCDGYNDNVLPPAFDQRRRESWQQIFNISDLSKQVVQGTTWKIERQQIIEATPFTAR